MFAPTDRTRALRALARFSAAPEFGEMHRLAHADFWPEWVSGLDEEQRRRIEEVSRESQAIYFGWIAFDYGFANGRPLVDVLLDTSGDRLTPGERDYLQRLRESHLGLYEVLEVRPEEGLRLRELWTGIVVWVSERQGTRQVARWDVLAARLVPHAAGAYIMEGAAIVFPVLAVEGILRELRRAHRDFTRRFPGGDHGAFFKWVGVMVHDLWLDLVVLRPGPRFVTAERDPVVFARVNFHIVDRRRLAARLAGHQELIRHDDSTYAWVEAAGSPRRSLGTFSISGDRLMLEAMSKQRAERGRRLLENLAGGAVRFRSVRYTDAGEALRQFGESGGGQDAASPAAVPPGLEARLAAEFYEQHYRRWLDTPVPALGNRTPRRAARLKTMRPRVIALLKAFENRSERLHRQGKPAYDFEWMWEELGLGKP